MITSTIVWHDAVTNPPEESKRVLCYYSHGFVQELPYSKKHNLYNAYDTNSEEDAKRFAQQPRYWADIIILEEEHE